MTAGRFGVLLGIVACTSADVEPVHTDDSDTGAVDTEDTGSIDSDTDLPEPVIELGSGLWGGTPSCTDFVAVPDGGDLAMTHGPQGGWHVDLAVRGQDVPELLSLTLRLLDVQTGSAVTSLDPITTNVRLVGDDPPAPWTGAGCYLGVRAVLDLASLGAPPAEAPWTTLTGRTMRAEVSAIGDGLTLVDTMSFVMRPDPCDDDLTAPGCLCDPDAGFRPEFCFDTDTDG